MTDQETFVLVKLVPNHGFQIRDGHVYRDVQANRILAEDGTTKDYGVLIGHTLELEHDIEIEVDAEPGDATTGRWRRRFLGKWQVGAHWEGGDDGSGS